MSVSVQCSATSGISGLCSSCTIRTSEHNVPVSRPAAVRPHCRAACGGAGSPGLQGRGVGETCEIRGGVLTVFCVPAIAVGDEADKDKASGASESFFQRHNSQRQVQPSRRNNNAFVSNPGMGIGGSFDNREEVRTPEFIAHLEYSARRIIQQRSDERKRDVVE